MAARRKKNQGGKLKYLFLLIMIIGILALINTTKAVVLSEQVKVEIPQNATTDKIAQLLYDHKLVRNPLVFKLHVKLKGLDGSLKAGEYEFSDKVSLTDIEEKISRGSAAKVSFTVPEGYNLNQIADLLADKGLIDREEFINMAAQGEFEYAYLPAAEDQQRLEGFLFPDTYTINQGFSEKQIIEMMLARFDQIYQPEWRKRAQELGMSDLEVITLASIIEREAKVAEDRPLISSVFHNRLEIGMRLESCATVQYALGEVKDVLLYEDLEIDSPYNTYLNTGLPPGPIASPGADSIKAALYPAETKYLYFVAKKDGSHYFSKTFAEHNAAKNKYLK